MIMQQKNRQNRLDNEQRSRMKIRYGDSSKYKGDIVDLSLLQILAILFSKIAKAYYGVLF